MKTNTSFAEIGRKLFPALLILLLVTTQVWAQAVRKNIDSLSATELATYMHAIQLLRDRSADNPYNMQGYAWQAWVHNLNRVSVPDENTLKQGDKDPTAFYAEAAAQTYADGTYGYPGMCEHGKDIFFVWHRAQFYYYEKILQNTDPDGTIEDSKGNKYPTRNLGIPFWNFTQPPSGDKFPAVFEDQSTVLYHAGRNTQHGADDKEFTSPYLLASLLSESHWPTFGGYVNATNGGYGTFESQMHNPMHDPYVGGDMAYPPRAAYDPIFYSFHAYIDYIFEAWLQRHGTDSLTSTGYFLRAQQPAEYNLPDYDKGLGDRPNMGRASLYLDISSLGYEFQARGKDSFYTPAQVEAFLTDTKGNPLEFGKSKESPYFKLFMGGVSRKPEKSGTVTSETITVRAADRNNPFIYVYTENDPTSSYQIDLYMHPPKVKPNIKRKKFRRKYFVRSATAWLNGSHGDHTMQEHKLNVDLTEAMNDLNKNNSGKEFKLSVNYNKL